MPPLDPQTSYLGGTLPFWFIRSIGADAPGGPGSRIRHSEEITMEIPSETLRARIVNVFRPLLIWLVIVLHVALRAAQRAVGPNPPAVAAQGAVAAKLVEDANAVHQATRGGERATLLTRF